MRKFILITTLGALALLLYAAFTLIFVRFFRVVSDTPLPPSPTPRPTFTATATETPLAALLLTPETATSTPSAPIPIAVSSPTPEPAPTETASATPLPLSPEVVSASTVNVRAGPGTNYPIIGGLSPGSPMPATGRNNEGSWWQVELADGQTGWVAGSVVEAQNVDGLPVAQAPAPPPPPSPTAAPPEPTRPAFQYEPTGWYAAQNRGLTRFLGTITDINGEPVNGVAVEAQCGGFRVISNPSGPVGGWGRSDSMTDPPGFYDLTIDRKPVPCKWTLTVVYTEDGKNVLSNLSEAVEVEVTVDQSVVTANWRKNW